ncbi:hypothetical protein GOD82_15035 [Sinorhizobium medicae]|uniref:hypothetical protein n=1 Tax=Sinorhizobium medicae TaxID=110321 RepID=UPI0013E3F68D|nr:hypothetical protein [Sinorhizobium medicae]MDX0831236.1 hypothetical protein [Sinorhizobium medicae]UFX00310.1 hypothetical protein SmedWSM1115_10840 [Sinorhizobium medicae WSM1115]
MADPKGHQGKATLPDKTAKSDVSRDYLTRARLVLKYAADLAPWRDFPVSPAHPSSATANARPWPSALMEMSANLAKIANRGP